VSIEIQAPQKLRDLLWTPALVRTGPSFKEKELGEVLVPVLYPQSFANQNDNVRLGRETHWQEVEGGEPIPVGQKIFLVDGEEFPLLEVRKIEFTAQESAAA
jgi:type VI secretion system protein ImpE